MKSKSKRSLQDVIVEETHSIWRHMLRALVPGGRTHRLSVVVAGMLQYALEKAENIKHRNEEKHAV